MDTRYSRGDPSPRFQELIALYQTMHVEGQQDAGIPAELMFAGQSLAPLLLAIKPVIERFRPKTLLDYGAGKGQAYDTDITVDDVTYAGAAAFWGVDSVTCYDPGHAPFSDLPKGRFDGVICTDVLEHIPQEDLPWVLAELFAYARVFVFGSIASYPAGKHLPNGENAHCTVRPKEWWQALIAEVAADFPGIRYLFTVDTVHPDEAGTAQKHTEAIVG
jgi:hypothetical protein